MEEDHLQNINHRLIMGMMADGDFFFSIPITDLASPEIRMLLK
jgi:hypothetical protein